MENARTRQWQVDRMVIPFTSLISQDVYFIKTRSKNYTTEGGINLQVNFERRDKCISNNILHLFLEILFNIEMCSRRVYTMSTE